MLIDWFTVGAQAFNFVILVWLLKRFLYKPILFAIDTRKKQIDATIAKANEQKAESAKERMLFERKKEEYENKRSELMSKMEEEVNIERSHLIDLARKESDFLSLKRQKALQTEIHNLHKTISTRTQKEVFSIVRKVLNDLTTISLEESLIDVFIKRLHEMDDETKSGFANIFNQNSSESIIRSAFNLSDIQRKKIQNALNEFFFKKINFKFEVAPNLISGIEFATNEWKIGWNMEKYILSLEKSVSELLEEHSQSEFSAKAKVESKFKSKSVDPKEEK